MHFTLQSGKKLKIEFSTPQTRVFYSSPFDLFNYTDSLFIKSLKARFPNTFLIIGLESLPESHIQSLQEREESLKRVPEINQILAPCPIIDQDFIQTYEIQYLITTPENAQKFQDLNLGESLVVVDPPLKLHKDELVGRILANKDKFLSKCLEDGISRKQLGVSLWEELLSRLKKVSASENWVYYRDMFVKGFRQKGRRFYKRISRMVNEFERSVEDSIIENFEE